MNKLLLILLCFLVCSFLSCASPGPTYFAYVHSPAGHQEIPRKTIHIWIDKNFGDADQVSIQAALDQWQFALNGQINLVVDSNQFDMQDNVLQHLQDGHTWIFLKVEGSNPFIQTHDREFGHAGYLILACTDSIGGNTLYLIRDRLVNSQITGVVIHEIGHLLGAVHRPNSLMQAVPETNNNRCIDLDTLKQVAHYQHLDYHTMNYCVYLSDKNH
jgi:hypothetical protein